MIDKDERTPTKPKELRLYHLSYLMGLLAVAFWLLVWLTGNPEQVPQVPLVSKAFGVGGLIFLVLGFVFWFVDPQALAEDEGRSSRRRG